MKDNKAAARRTVNVIGITALYSVNLRALERKRHAVICAFIFYTRDAVLVQVYSCRPVFVCLSVCVFVASRIVSKMLHTAPIFGMHTSLNRSYTVLMNLWYLQK